MTLDRFPEPLWINEPDWLCAVEFLNDEDPEGRDLAADTIGYLLGYPFAKIRVNELQAVLKALYAFHEALGWRRIIVTSLCGEISKE